MATKITTTGSSTIKSGVSSSVEDPKTYDDVFTSKYTFTEANGAGANAFKIHSDTVAVVLSLKGTSGDVIIIDGYSGDYTAKLAGSKLTLVNNNQVITVALAAKSVVTLKFLDGSKDVNLVEKTLGDEPLVTKSGVLHINGVSSHELTSVTTAVKTALTDVNKKNYATVDAAIISDNTLVKSNALTDKSGKSYATVDAAIADAKTQALAPYSTLDLAIQSNDGTVITKAVTDSGTGFTSLADLVAAYNQLTPISRPTFKVESLNATMVPTSPAIVNEGDKANFKISLVGNGTGDYTVKTMLVPLNGTTTNDYQSLTLDPTLNSPGITFNNSTGVLTIPAKSTVTSAILTAKINNNLSLDTGKTINLTLSEPKGDLNATLMTAATTANFTIKDVTPATFSVTPNIGPVLEGTPTTFTVTLANHALSPYSVKVALTGNNAVLNSDFSALTLDPTTPATIKFDSTTGILTIPADSKTTSVKFNTNIRTDIIAEKTQSSVTLALSQDTTNSANANTVITPATSSTTTVITDITPAFSVTAGSSTVDEGKPASFTVSLANATTGDYKVNLAATQTPSFSNILALDSNNSNTGITFAGGILTIPTKTITDANTAKTPIKATLTSLTSPIDNTSISLVLSNPTGTNVATAPAPATISINNVSATLLTKEIDTITTPDNSNTLIIGNTLTINANTTLFDSIKDNSIIDNDVLNISTNSWPLTALSDTVTKPTTKAISIDGIETINLNALDTINVDMSSIKNAKIFNIKDSTAPVTLTAISDAAMVLGLSGVLVNTLNATYKAALVKTTDTLNVTLDNATNASLVVNSDKPFGFATLNIIGTSSLKSFDASATPLLNILTISGNGALTVQTNALKYIQDIELSNTNIIKFGKIGDPTDATTIANYPYLTTFKAPTNIEGITTGLIQGATGGFTMQLGSGPDSISVQDNAATATNINDIRLGARDDILNFSTPTTGKTYISGDDGNDTIIISLTTAGSSTSINTIDGGSGDDRITIAIDPTITTISSSFIIIGGMGSDSISGSIGSDTIDGGDGNDTIYGSGGIDNITGGAGNDTIYVDSGTDKITDFTIGSDKLIISSAATAYVYASGVANYSNDVTNSGTGKLYIDRSQTYAGIPVTIAENITGSSGADSIKGGAGNDTITGGLGSDSITAGAGIDTITDFKVGEDTLSIIAGATAHVYASTTATGTAQSVAYAFSNAGTLYIDGATTYNGLTVTGAESITGSTGADSIVGGAGSDSINGGAGNDTIIGGLGNDTVIGGSSDTIIVDAGTDTINNFTIGTDTLSVNSGATAKVTFSGGSSVNYNPVSNLGILDITIAAGTSSVTGSIGADSITGSAGNDSIDGGSGNDTIFAGAGSDSITVSVGTDTITDFKVGEDTLTILSGATAKVSFNGGTTVTYNAVSNSGILNLTIAAGTSTVTGSTGADSITGSAGTDSIDGGTGNDTISGADGNDTITGGDGNDIISGGSGRNTINVDSGTDTITDFLLSYDTLNVSSPSAIAHLYAFTTATGGTVNYSNISNLGTLYIDGSTTYAGTQITGIESIIGSNGADFIVGGMGNDIIYGRSGDDTITSGAGRDEIEVDYGSTDTITDFNPILDKLTIHPKYNNINSTAHVYASGTVSYMTAVANSGILYIDGSRSYTDTAAITTAASITGSTGADSIVGGSGADTITGGTGIDTLTGGAGADTFVFGTDGSIYSPNSPNTAQDSIIDFTSGTDLIRFAGAVDKTIGTITGGQVDNYGFATFNSVLSYSAKVSALQVSDNTKKAQIVTLFADGTDTYVFFAGASADITTDDQVIKLTGVSGRFFDEITKVNDTDITIS